MRVVVTGASGFLGQRLVATLRGDGHEVARLVRREPSAPDEIAWRPDVGYVDVDALAGTDAVVNLAGAGLGDRPWTPAYRRTVLTSRTSSTGTIATAIAGLRPAPKVLLSSAGVGYYGNPGDTVVDESAPPGPTYMARIVREWEAATAPAAAAGIRVVTMRTSPVVSGKGGIYGSRLIPIVRLGLGGRLGSGRQWWSWVALHDYLRAVRFLLDRDDMAGPVNVTAPEPLTNADQTRAMGRVLRRPTVFWMPGPLLKVPFRDFADDILGGQRVVPSRLLEAGFEFERPSFEEALRAELADARTS